MSTKIHYTHCPVCASSTFKKVLDVVDQTVSHESFEIMECPDCGLRFTQDIPGQEAISKYYKSEDYISHTNTARGLINNVYQAVRKRTLKTKRKLVEKLTGLKKGTLLDIGSGIGSFASEMKENGWQITALEPDAGAREKAKQLYGLRLDDMNAFNQMQAESFDAITLWHVLEHVHELHPYMKQLGSVLKETGRLFIAVPNYTSKDAAYYANYWAAYDVPRHLYHFSPRSMQMLLEKNGLKLQACKPMWYDSFYISMLSSKYKNGFTNIPSAIVQGLRSNLNALKDPRNCSSVIYVVSR